jgi:hypothetical protein
VQHDCTFFDTQASIPVRTDLTHNFGALRTCSSFQVHQNNMFPDPSKTTCFFASVLFAGSKSAKRKLAAETEPPDTCVIPG